MLFGRLPFKYITLSKMTDRAKVNFLSKCKRVPKSLWQLKDSFSIEWITLHHSQILGVGGMRVICAVHACTQFFCWLLCYWQQIKKKNIIFQKIQVMPAILVPRPQNRPFSTVKRSEKEEKNINLRFTYLKICFYIFLLCMYLIFV